MNEHTRDNECNSDAWWTERSLPVKILMGIGFGILGIGLLFLFGFIVKVLWNWLMPDIFGLKQITYWQAWGLLILSCILFGRLGGGGNGGSGQRSDRKRKSQLRRYIREEQLREMGKMRGTETGSGPDAEGHDGPEDPAGPEG